MPQEATPQQKADQIAHRFFVKFALVIDHARNVVSEPREDTKPDKWFNLETPDSDIYREQVRLYRAISQLSAPPPPLEMQVLLTVPELTDKQVLVQHPPDASRRRVEPTPTHVLLESWTLTFVMSTSGSPSSSQMSTGEVTLATVYKHIMSVIRSLYTLLHALPTWKICKRLRRRPGSGARIGQLGLVLRVRTRSAEALVPEHDVYLGFDEPLSPSAPPLETATHTFDPVAHPMGIFSASVRYLKAPHFEIDTVEALLSSRFLSLDAGPEFTPTLARNPQRESLSGSPGSLPMRTSLPRSPPGDKTDKDKSGLGLALGAGATSNAFVFPVRNPVASGSRTSLPSTSPRSRNAPLPPAGAVQRSISAQQPQTVTGTGSAGSIGSSSRHSREEGRESLPSIARVRRESMGRGSDLPSSPGPLLIRRQSTTVSPFKSGTLSSGSPSLYSNSPSLRYQSPLAGPSLPAAPAGRTPTAAPPSPTSARLPGSRGDTGAGPSSPTTYRAGSSPVLPLRPSPPTPFAPSSLGERRYLPSPVVPSPTAELVSLNTEPLPAAPRRKRYSSSFGYRYAAAGSDGSAGSGDKGKEPERPGSASYLSTNTDDDDISAFVQDIDARKPIGGGFGIRHERTLSDDGLAGRAFLAGAETPEQIHQTRTPERRPEVQPSFVPRRSRTMSEGAPSSGIAREVAAAVSSEAGEVSTSQQSGAPVSSHLNIDERLRVLNDAFRTSMGLVERRPNTVGGSSQEEPALSSPFPARPAFPIPGAAHLRTPSFSASGGVPTERPSSAPGQGRSSASSDLAPRRRFADTRGGSNSGEGTSSIWDNRRLRADSTGSSASALSDMDRARMFYEQGRTSRGSGASVGGVSLESEEAVGRMSLERAE